MGRPKEHGETTRIALLDAAERLVESGGIESLSIRRVADEVGTTTRAVYSLFGSKRGLVIALGSRAFEWLAAELDSLPITQDPKADLIDAGADVFRRLAVEHPSLFRIGVQQSGIGSDAAVGIVPAAEDALERLETRLERLRAAGGLQGRSLRQAAFEFHALCEGLAALELRCAFAAEESEHAWRSALGTLVSGFMQPFA
ncbi:MAG TPA: TetR/AcrR family transcriptional regulator [Acidimicrobiales bacterium]|nr:TetR/AcrR family transcriptional regulator [Acidimicrobiales bacterium]